MSDGEYKTVLHAGCGFVPDARTLLEVWQPGMNPSELVRRCLDEGRFPNVAARTLSNRVREAFARRYLVDNERPAVTMKTLLHKIPAADWTQLAFLYSARAVMLLRGFLREVYWPHYAAGRNSVGLADACEFVRGVSHLGNTSNPWSPSIIDRNGSYVLRTMSDFGLVENTRRPVRKILPFSIRPTTTAVLANDLHLRGIGDNAVIAHEDWRLFGLEETDVREELKGLARRDLLILQTAGATVRISWRCNTWEEFLDVLTEG